LKLKSLRNRADKAFKEKVLEINKYYCEVCGSEASTAHHFIPRSQSNATRYYLPNGISICQKCHFQHHTKGDPSIHAELIKLKGWDWYNDLQLKRQQICKVNKSFYENIISNFKEE